MQPTWIVIFRAKDALHCQTQYFGPFADYIEAEDCLCGLPAAIDCDHKFIQPLQAPNYINGMVEVQDIALSL